jgi:hypothetical protein
MVVDDGRRPRRRLVLVFSKLRASFLAYIIVEALNKMRAAVQMFKGRCNKMLTVLLKQGSCRVLIT